MSLLVRRLLAVSAIDTPPVDAVVVGAGIGGLSAARGIHSAGRTVVVLEARDRVGGRLLSHAMDGGALDLGATWFWPGEAWVAALVEELGVPTHPQHLSGDAVYHDPSGSSRVAGNPLDMPSHRFTDGADSLATALAARLPAEAVVLGRRVVSIASGPDGGLIVADADGRAVHARHVVIAVPPALAAARIVFTPGLPEELTALVARTPVWMGSMAKVVTVFATPFWREAGLAGSAISHFGPMREVHDMSGPGGDPAALFGFVPVRSAGQAALTTDQITRQLAEIFGDDAPRPTEILISDWSAEQDTSPPGAEQLTAYETFGDPRFRTPALDGRLHWASTETAEVNPGHIEGAIQAGERAAAAVTAALDADAGQPSPVS